MKIFIPILLISLVISCSESAEKKTSSKNTKIEIDFSKNKGKVIDGKKEGKWTSYYTNDQLESISFWKDNKPVGKVLCWWPNGKLKQEICFIDGLQDSIMRTWYENGNQEEKSYWKQDQANGPAKTFFKNGKIETEGNWLMGKENGEWNYYDSLGKLINSRLYNNGEFVNTFNKVNGKIQIQNK